jgi:sec-independent protein translocase protein TatB
MFEVGFSELVVIAIIALVVLGPERLPKAARMAGTFMRKARRSFESLKMEVERELEADTLKKQFADIAAAPAEFAASMQAPFAEAKTVLEDNIDGLTQDAKAALSPDVAEAPGLVQLQADTSATKAIQSGPEGDTAEQTRP